MKKIIFYAMLLFMPVLAGAQSWPIIVDDSYQISPPTLPIIIFSSSNGGTSQGELPVDGKLVSNGQTAGSVKQGRYGTSTSIWYQVDLPGTTSAAVGYIPAGATISNPECSSQYITINAASMPISISAGSSSYVKIGNSTANVFYNQNFAVKSSQYAPGTNTLWYEIYLTTKCSPTTGWVSSGGRGVSISTIYALPAPLLNPPTGYTGTSVQLSWSMSVQPSGYTNTSFEIWRATGTGNPVKIGTATTNNYTDQTLAAGSSYIYHIVARYNTCQSQDSNTQPVGSQTGGTGSITVNILPAAVVAAARWQLDGSGSNSSGSGVSAAYGAHTISFSPVSGYNTPPNQNVTLSNGSPYQLVTATYTPIAVNCTSYPSPPGNVQASATSSSEINLTWQAAAGAASYNIYDCAGNKVDNSSSNSYTVRNLLPGTFHSYKITSVSGAGCESKSFSSPCAGATTNYVISGQVTDSANPTTGISGVTVTTSSPPPQYSAITDASGYYSISNMPTTYSGTVSASLTGYTFAPPSLPVSASNYSSKNFSGTKVPPAVISIASSIIPPWQRESDAFSGVVNVDLSKARGNPWYLEIYVYKPNENTPSYFVFYPGTTSSAINFNSADFQLAQLITDKKLVSGCRVTYSAILGTQSNKLDVKNVSIGTNIIDAKWDKQNVVYFNDAIESLNIPLKYIDKTTGVIIKFTRKPNTSTASNLDNVFPITPLTLGYFAQDKNLPVLKIDQNHSNLQNVSPGIFDFEITYVGTSTIETGTIDLTKIGKVIYPLKTGLSPNANRLMILIGGIRNDVENKIRAINQYSGDPSNAPYSRNSNLDMSIISYFNAQGYDTWYIAQPNLNGVRQNAYDIGIAIEEIKKIRPETYDINVICHSKGGLEIRALLGTSTNFNNLTQALNGQSFNYSNSSIANMINKVAFIATPHRGALIANLLSPFAPSDGVNDLIDPLGLNPNHIITILNSTIMPRSALFLNLTATGPHLPVIFPLVASLDNDAVVDMSSSEGFSTNNGIGYFQLYQDFSHHLTICQNNSLSQYGHYSCFTNNKKNIDYLTDFFDGTLTQTCHRNPFDFYSLQTIKSILSNARIKYKILSDTSYADLGVTDENGKINFRLFNNFNLGDTIKITANGVDMEQFAVTPLFNSSHKLSIAMFLSSVPSNKLQYASLSLVNQNPITNQKTIQIKATAKNVSKFYINVHNSDTTFIQAFPANDIIPVTLDTGYNKIIVKYIGTAKDTAMLSKDVYYLPGTLMDTFARDLTVNTESSTTAKKMFVNNIFYQDIKSTTTLKLLKEVGEAKFTRYGYRDTIFTLDTFKSINLQMQPYSYSSLTDSSIYDFNTGLNPQYWKNVSLKNISSTADIQISALQYDDAYAGMGLKQQSRKFVFRNLTGNPDVKLRAAIALDQAETPDIDSVYLLSFKNGKYTKYQVNVTGTTEYDPQVQKVAFDSISLKPNGAQEIVLMRKQPAIPLSPVSLEIEECKTQNFPISMFVADPDSIKNDLTITSADASVIVDGNFIRFNDQFGRQGSYNFKLSFTHDFVTVNKTYTMTVLPCPIRPPNAFTPNADGINDTWNIPDLGNFPNCMVEIFTRNGQKVFNSVGYGKAWDGTYGGKALPTGVYYYIIKPSEPGYKTISGNVTIIR